MMFARKGIRSATKRIEKLVTRLLADSESYDGKMSADAKNLWTRYLRRCRRPIFVALAITVVWSAHPYYFSLLSRFLVDDVLMVETGFDIADISTRFALLRRYVYMLFGGWTVIVILHWFRSSIVLGTGQKLIFDLRHDLHEKLQNLHVGYFERNETGKIMSRVLEDVWVIKEWSTTHALNVSAQFFQAIFGVGLLLYLNWQLTAVIVLSLPIYAWALIKIRPTIRRLNIALRRLNASMYALSAERITAVTLVKAFTQEARERATFFKRIHDNVRISMRIIGYSGGMNLLAGMISSTVTGLIIMFGMLQVRAGLLTLGDVMVFIHAMPRIFMQVNALSSVVVQIQAVFVVVKRVLNLLDEEVGVTPGTAVLDGMRGKVTFDRVTFTYPGQSQPALDDVSFSVEPGEKIAIMGPSGGGKTTVFQLICRFYDPQAGSIHVGGVDLVDTDPTSVRRHACMVQQEPVIFSGTIAENIMYGRLDARPSEIMLAAKQAELHDFIMTLPAKYETEVGQNGISLSGGQKQRLALATALLTQPEILMLDDTTSALDSETEAKIRATLEKVLGSRTSLVITQRIATARSCDKILVFENGKIVQRGTHDELKNVPGFYQKILAQQESL